MEISSLLHEAKGLTADILDQLFALRFPWIRDELPDPYSTSGGPSDVHLRRLAWPLLQSLSLLGPSPTNVPDLLRVLPAPSHPKFPSRVVALVFLLDQCSRYYCMRGTNARWLCAFFDPLTQRLLDQLFDLPADLQLLRHDRWTSVGYPHYLVITSLLFTAADHAEDVERHRMLHDWAEERRREIFERTGARDPFTETLRRDAADPLSFSKWMASGLPRTSDPYERMYLRLAIVDLHAPIIEQFGRYPYRNSSMGRACTSEEILFLDASAHFGEPDRDAVKRIEQDIAAGQWTPLEDDLDTVL